MLRSSHDYQLIGDWNALGRWKFTTRRNIHLPFQAISSGNSSAISPAGLRQAGKLVSFHHALGLLIHQLIYFMVGKSESEPAVRTRTSSRPLNRCGPRTSCLIRWSISVYRVISKLQTLRISSYCNKGDKKISLSTFCRLLYECNLFAHARNSRPHVLIVSLQRAAKITMFIA